MEYSSNYSETTGRLSFYSKDEATDFNADIANTNDFKSFKYRATLLENTEADGANRILKNVISTILYLLYQHNKITKRVYNNLIKSL